MGSITISTGLPIPYQTDTAANQDIALLEGYNLCLNGQWPAIHQRG